MTPLPKVAPVATGADERSIAQRLENRSKRFINLLDMQKPATEALLDYERSLIREACKAWLAMFPEDAP